jgi:hypothetical protein
MAVGQFTAADHGFGFDLKTKIGGMIIFSPVSIGFAVYLSFVVGNAISF